MYMHFVSGYRINRFTIANIFSIMRNNHLMNQISEDTLRHMPPYKNTPSIRLWSRYRPPKVRVKNLIFGGVFMAKYSEEFKIKVVTEYLYGDLGYKALSKKYNIASALSLKNWVRSYKTQGMDGLKRRKSKMTYSVQFKLDAIQFILETGASYPET